MFPEFIRFERTTDSLPPPNRDFLEAHFAIAEILHVSDMEESIDQTLYELEEFASFPQDGQVDAGYYICGAFAAYG